MHKRGMAKVVVGILIIVVLVAAIYFTFFYFSKCGDAACFKSNQKVCKKTVFRNDAADAVWLYKIKGKSEGDCKIYVELVQIKDGERRTKTMEGKSMICLVPYGSTDNPESDIKNCHGILREEIQEAMIQKMHSYLIENLGEIKEEF